MQDIEDIRESFEREQDAIDADVVLVVKETHHPPCSCHSSRTDVFGVFDNPGALADRLREITSRRQAKMSVRVQQFHE
jgi:hypothetical protein